MKSISLPISKPTLSHFLLTPLSGVMSNLRLLDKEGLPLTPQQKSRFEDALASSEALLKFAQYLIKQSETMYTTVGERDETLKQAPLPFSILLVEDCTILQRAHRAILEHINCQTDVANNGYEALKMLDHQYDAVLLDISMPGMDGYETAIRIRKERKMLIPIIGVTAHPLEEVWEKCLSSGFNTVLQKPLLDATALKEQLHAFILHAQYAEN